jgi:hypothetical protein
MEGGADTSFALSLTINASQFTVSVEGCASGYSAVMTEVDPSIDLYFGDLGCVAKLQSFTLDGVSYVPDPLKPFTSYAQGEVARFIGTPGDVVRLVRVARQLPSPITSQSPIAYRISELLQSAANSSILDGSLGLRYTAIKGTDLPPDFRVHSIAIIGENGAAGTLYLKFELECLTTLGNFNNNKFVNCSGVNLLDLRYVLIEDLYSDQPCTSANITACDAAFATGGTGTTPTTLDEVISPKAGTMPNGGFFTSVVAPLATPRPLQQAPRLMLMIKTVANNKNGTTGGSYQIHNVDFAIVK